MTLCSWEGNRRSGVALAMRHRLSGLSTYTSYRLNGLDREMSTPPTLRRGTAHFTFTCVTVVLKVTAKGCWRGRRGGGWYACRARSSSVVAGSWTRTTESCMTSKSRTTAGTVIKRSVAGIVSPHTWSTGNASRYRLNVRNHLPQPMLSYPSSVMILSFRMN